MGMGSSSMGMGMAVMWFIREFPFFLLFLFASFLSLLLFRGFLCVFFRQTRV
jgi:hypothetical protein